MTRSHLHALHSSSCSALIVLLISTGCLPSATQTSIEGGVDQGQRVTVYSFDASGELPPVDMALSDPCDPNPCPAGVSCRVEDGVAVCPEVSCEQLECRPGEVCVPPPPGSPEPPRCVPDGCLSDLDCPLEEHCDVPADNDSALGDCVDDLCDPGERRCDGVFVEACDANGADFTPLYQCDLDRSACLSELDSSGRAEASCLCQDAWDCPAPMRCEQGRCQGRPEPPSCLLTPAPFEASLPSPELTWGGSANVPPAMASAEGSPFPESVQVVMTPLVVNLNDDTGDGRIDERDTPDLLFMSFCGSSFRTNGALRAVHGGGPDRGRDLWARLGPHLWRQGEALPDVSAYQCDEGDLDPTAAIAAADLDDPVSTDGQVEVVAVHETDGLVIFSHAGEVVGELLVGQMPNMGGNPAISIANIDGEGMAELIVGRLVFQLTRSSTGRVSLAELWEGSGAKGTNGQGSISCVADLNGDGRAEVIAGGTAYQLPRAPRGLLTRAECASEGGTFEPQTLEEDAWCSGELMTYWDILEVNPSESVREGFCAVADVWGADLSAPPSPSNPLDGLPEVILISNGVMRVLSGATGALITRQDVGANNDRGGAPNVDDFDGDGFPEVGAAFAQGYRMMDLQPPSPACPAWEVLLEDEDQDGRLALPTRSPGPAQCSRDDECVPGEASCVQGRCVCLHNGWQRATEDNSSKVTGSTLFDFNGDGSSEVIYNDECFFRIYDGLDGRTLFKRPSESRTRIEHPIVADVDNDGNAEIVFSTSTESTFCSVRNQPDEQGVPFRERYNPGVEVWGDPQDRWVSARRVWSQHAYHITHVTEAGAVPSRELRGWGAEGEGRGYNSYRSQPKRYGVAPDLLIEALEVVTGGACNEGGGLSINTSVLNAGDVRVGPGIQLTFEGEWPDVGRVRLSDPQGLPISIRTEVGLEPEGRLPLRVTYNPALDASLPSALQATQPTRIWALIDQEEGSDFGRERECDEENNERSAEVNETLRQLPELRVELTDVASTYCPEVTLSLLVYNEGSAPTEGVSLSLYIGDPREGGVRVDQLTLPSALTPGQATPVEWVSQGLPYGREVRLWVAVDPQNLIAECAEDNNLTPAPSAVQCVERDGG